MVHCTFYYGLDSIAGLAGQEILQYENLDLENIVTPVRAEVFRNLLIASGYDSTKTEFLYKGFSGGFELHHKALADPRGGARDARPPWGSKFFHFHAVFGKNVKNNSNFGSWRPPWGKSWIRHCKGKVKVQKKAPNLKLRVGNKIELWNKVVKEGRYAGPFKEIPYDYFIQSPIGLVPKDHGVKTRWNISQCQHTKR